MNVFIVNIRQDSAAVVVAKLHRIVPRHSHIVYIETLVVIVFMQGITNRATCESKR